ncbi:hypothetical protein ABZX62_20810 [Streptomyces flavidovirens]|uniref:hypothetical protein n=1 Tax=Streptomyces flavidovirens TaxID=67298 RepID=UPI0033B94372
MAHAFQLLLMQSDESKHLYRARYDNVREAFLVLDEALSTVQPSNENGVTVGDLRLSMNDGNIHGSVSGGVNREDFALSASHLAYQWKKLGFPPAEVRKFFS